jgi:hypothetical protein
MIAASLPRDSGASIDFVSGLPSMILPLIFSPFAILALFCGKNSSAPIRVFCVFRG